MKDGNSKADLFNFHNLKIDDFINIFFFKNHQDESHSVLERKRKKLSFKNPNQHATAGDG